MDCREQLRRGAVVKQGIASRFHIQKSCDVQSSRWVLRITTAGVLGYVGLKRMSFLCRQATYNT